jgi:hypothetical protein
LTFIRGDLHPKIEVQNLNIEDEIEDILKRLLAFISQEQLTSI